MMLMGVHVSKLSPRLRLEIWLSLFEIWHLPISRSLGKPGFWLVLCSSEATSHKQWKEVTDSKPETLTNTQERKNSFSTVNFSKVDPLYKCRSASFYREMNELFTYRDYPRVKWINTECARLILGGLHLGLHVIGASWRHTINHGAFPGMNTCACRVKTLSFLC
jgi:hypothetical protein